jgi:hypothetical protein
MWEWKYSSTFLNLDIHYTEASGQLYAPANLTPAKEPAIPFGQEAKWAPEAVWMLQRREKSCPANNRSRTV